MHLTCQGSHEGGERSFMIVLSTRVNDDAVVLIVENNPPHIAWLKDICKKAGFLEENIYVEKEVTKARDQIERLKADLVLLDLATAESRNNPSLGARELAKWQGGFAVIVVTGHHWAVEGSRNAYAVITKPPEPNKYRPPKTSAHSDSEKQFASGEAQSFDEQRIKRLREEMEHFKEQQTEQLRQHIESFRAQEMERFREQVSLAIRSALDLKRAGKTLRATWIQKLAAKQIVLTITTFFVKFTTNVTGITFVVLVIVSLLVVLGYTFLQKSLPSWILNK
jgi:CheY-like chemotaxis protein